ncbi:MAG: LysR family transcriptional regulator [Polyangiaceae bacterium]
MGQSFDPAAAVVLVEVVDKGSFRGAARSLGMPKSSVSRRVADLEAHLGVRLLQRTTRRIGLTHAGQAYYSLASAAVAALRDAESAARDLSVEARGPLRISAPVNFGTLVLPAILAEFLTKHRAVRAEVELADRHVDLIDEGFDVAIRAGFLPDSTLVAQRLTGARVVTVTSPAYLRKRGRPRVPADLAEHDCLLFGAGSSAVWTFSDSQERVDVTVTGPLSANNFFVLRDAASAGLGIARVPEMLARQPLTERRLVTILDPHVPPEVPLHAVYPSARHLSPKVRLFVEHLRERLAGEPAKKAPAPKASPRP